MPGERTIRIKFDGTARGLKRAADDAARQIDGLQSKIGAKAGVFARIGQKIGLDLTSGVSGAFSSMPPQVQAVAVAAAVGIGAAMSSAIAAALTAGVLLAVGGGVLAAGIVAAAKSPKVQAAWKTFGDRSKKALDGFSKPFEGPLVRAADTFGDALERMAPTLKDMGKSMAPLIDKLAPAFASMAEKALPGIQKAMEKSKPLFETIARHAPKIGEAISKFFDNISEGAPGAERFLQRVLEMIEFWLPVLGKVIAWFSNFFITIDDGIQDAIGWFTGFASRVLDAFGVVIHGAADAFGWMPGIGPKLRTAAAKFDEFKDKANNALSRIKNRTVHVDATLRGITNVDERAAVRLGRRAHGGPVAAHRSYLVGERGPEVFTPGTSGNITPNHKLGGPDVLQLTLDLGRGIQQVIEINLRERDRGLVRRAMAGAGRR